LFFGKVTKYGPPQRDGEEPLYHIVWEDGDEEDFTDEDLEKGKKLLKEKGSPEKTRKSLRRTSRGSLHDDRRSSDPTSGLASNTDNTVAYKKRKMHSSPMKDRVEESASDEEQEEEPQWTTAHDIVGKRVVAYFAVPDENDSGVTVSKPFGGNVTRYAPPSRPGRKDQLYHIKWDDEVRDGFF